MFGLLVTRPAEKKNKKLRTEIKSDRRFDSITNVCKLNGIKASISRPNLSRGPCLDLAIQCTEPSSQQRCHSAHKFERWAPLSRIIFVIRVASFSTFISFRFVYYCFDVYRSSNDLKKNMYIKQLQRWPPNERPYQRCSRIGH